MKKVMVLAVISLVVFWIVSNPTGAGATARAIGSGLADIGTGIGTFLASLTGSTR